MRRLRTAVPAVLATAVAVVTLSTGTALAQGSEHGGHSGAKASHAKQAEQQQGTEAEHHKSKKPKKMKSVVTLTGVISDTPTATIGSGSDTATSTITIAVKGGERTLHNSTVVLTLDKFTVVRRAGTPDATAASLQKGDHVSVKARRMPDGSWLALRVNARPAKPEGTKSDD